MLLLLECIASVAAVLLARQVLALAEPVARPARLAARRYTSHKDGGYLLWS